MKTKLLEVLSKKDIRQIDAESKRILSECGVRVLHAEALDLLKKIGCTVDRSASIVRMPPNVVEKAVDAAPDAFSLYGRDPALRIDLSGENVYFGPGGFAIFAEDLETGKRRVALRKDLIEHLRLSDALPTCEFNHVNVNASDIRGKAADLQTWADALIYQTKPIMSENYDARSVDALVAMVTVLRGSQKEFLKKPQVCLDVCTLSPLTQDKRQVDLLLAGARYGLPISIESGPIAGASSPVTLAAVVCQANVEILSAIVITYAAKPGTPVLYGSWGRHLDMRHGLVTMGGPEFALLKVTTAQMARFYGLPSRGGGALTDSLISDAQAGYEKMLTTLVPALAGVNYISGMGLNETENCQSLAQLVIDDEIVLMVQRVLRGIEVDREHIASRLIMSTGPGGNFLAADHTLKFFKQELFDPRISNRAAYESWSNKGSKSVRDQAAEKARDILGRTPEHTLDSKMVAKLCGIVKKME